MLENYSSILEKTNNQLGLWLALSNYTVTILGVMVAVIAIWVALALWKNSKEQKDKFESFLNSQEKLFRENTIKFEQIAKKGREDAEKKLDALIAEQQQKMSSATAESKKVIQKAIDNLEAAKATVGTGFNINPSGYFPQLGHHINSSGYLPNTGIKIAPPGYNPYLVGNYDGYLYSDMMCATCGKTFDYVPSSSGNQIYCTHCGAINTPN